MKPRRLIRMSLTMLSFSLLACPGYAGQNKATQKEVQAKIDEFNQRIKEAGDKGDLQAAIEAAEQALATATQGFGAESPEAARAKNNVANLYMFAGHPANAEQLYKEAVLIQSKKDSESVSMADSLYNLSMAYGMQQKYDEARQMMDRAYKIRLSKLGPDDADTQKAAAKLKEISAEN